MSKLIDLQNERFGKLTVIKRVDNKVYKNGRSRPQWLCQCDCGNKIIVAASNLRNGNTQSCGCLQKEMTYVSHKKYNKYDLSGNYGIGYTSKNQLFYFDKEDYDKIKQYCWSMSSEGYICTVINDKFVKFHRLIFDMGNSNNVIDHINHIKSDNRKMNLRICKQEENCRNRKATKNSKSGYNGITWNKKTNKWIATIKDNKKLKYLGSFVNLGDAIKIRKEAEIKYYGDYAYKYNLLKEYGIGEKLCK